MNKIVGIFILVFLSTEVNSSIKWLALSKLPTDADNQEIAGTKSLPSEGLTRRQTRLLRKDDTLAPVVKNAANTVIAACGAVFNQSRWNCSSLSELPHISPELRIGTKEQAYVYALASSQLAVNVATACSKGTISECHCSDGGQDTVQEDFLRNGCSVNLRFGLRFSERFTESSYKKIKKLMVKGKDIPESVENNEAIMNIHNGKVGRQAVRDSITTRCKCHGMSGSCEVKTCWTDLDNKKLLNDLAVMYESAQALPQLSSVSNSLITSPSPQSQQHDKREAEKATPTLMFYRMSSDYCNYDPRKGSHGTKGRKCGDEYHDTCSTMCCGRGHRQIIHTLINNRCHCKHIWCCYVECDTCKVDIKEYYCN